jgi:hypothetical protein
VRSPLPLLAVLVTAVLGAAGPAHAHPLARHDHRDTVGEVQVDLAAAVGSADALQPSAQALDPVTYLPTTWCGTARASDDTEHAAQPVTKARFKLVYAYASGQPNRFAAWADALQGSVSVIGRFMSATGKVPRWDMGTSCGPAYVDIQTVALTGTREAYVGKFGALRDEVQSRLGSTGARRNAVIFADGLTSGGTSGLGEAYNGDGSDLAGSANPHNSGGLTAAIYVHPSVNPPASSADGVWPEGFLHEISHTMGAVQFSAPHTSAAADGTPRGHCWDGSDVMCYADGLSPKVAYDPNVCPRSAAGGPMAQHYDCNGDDYFNPAPAPGSYLATHWNLWDSVFYDGCATQGLACGAAAAAAPANVEAPKLSGELAPGSTLSTDQGAWSGSPTAYAVTWQRSATPGGSFADIAGAAGATYVLQDADAGRQIRAAVTASNANGSAMAYSAAVTAAALPLPPPPVAPPPAAPVAAGAETTTVATTAPAPVPSTGTASGTPTAPSTEAVAAAATHRTLTLRRAGHAVLTLPLLLRLEAGATKVQTVARHVKLPSGHYRLRLCAGTVCRTASFVARRGSAVLPRLTLGDAPARRVVATLHGPRRAPSASASLTIT